jgi:hypothetical protein
MPPGLRVASRGGGRARPASTAAFARASGRLRRGAGWFGAVIRGRRSGGAGFRIFVGTKPNSPICRRRARSRGSTAFSRPSSAPAARTPTIRRSSQTLTSFGARTNRYSKSRIGSASAASPSSSVNNALPHMVTWRRSGRWLQEFGTVCSSFSKRMRSRPSASIAPVGAESRRPRFRSLI